MNPNNIIVTIQVSAQTAQAQQAMSGIQNQMRNMMSNLPGGGILGAFVFGGAAAGAFAAINAGIALVKDMSSEMIQLGKDSVHAAGDMQATTNSFILFTGSLQSAKKELIDIDRITNNVPGLKLEDAEQGAKRLRAMGFAAQDAQNIITGMAKQALIFGGGSDSDQNMLRVLRHLDQLKGGMDNTKQVINMMVRDMPGLAVVMKDTFGSVDKFQAALSQDASAALTKFGLGLANAKAPAGGFNAAMTDVVNSVTMAEREFGKPILDPLTHDLKELVIFLHDNKQEFANWGQYVGDVIRGLSTEMGLFQRMFATGGGLTGKRPDQNDTSLGATVGRMGGTGLTGFMIGGPLGLAIANPLAQANELGIRERLQQEQHQRDMAPSQEELFQRLSAGGIKNFQGPLSEDSVGEMLAHQRDAERQLADDARTALNKEKQVADDLHRQQLTGVQQYWEGQKAIANEGHLYTFAQEAAHLTKIHDLQNKSLDVQLNLQEKYFADQRKFAEGDQKELQKIDIKQAEAEQTIASQRLLNDAQFQKDKTELAFHEAEKRRAAAIQANQFEQQSQQQSYNIQLSKINQQIEITGHGYDQLRALDDQNLTQETDLIRKNLALQLQDRSLTAEERVNIEKDANLKIQAASEQNRTQQLEIDKRQYQQRIKAISDFANQIVAVQSQIGSATSSIQGTLGLNPFFGAGLPQFGVPAALDYQGGFKVSSSIDLAQLAKGGTSIYGAKSDVLDAQQKSQTIALDAQLKAANDRLEAARKLSYEDLQAAQNEKVVLELRKSQLFVEQQIEKNNLKMDTDLATISEWTTKIASGDRDRIILGYQQIAIGKQYQDVVIKAREQEVLLADKSLLQTIRTTESLKTQTEFRNRDLDAILAMDRAQADMTDKMVYHQTQADAAVATHIAQVKGLTEIYRDAKTGIVDGLFGGIDRMFQKLTGRFPILSQMLSEFLSGLTKLFLSPFLNRLLTGQTPSSSSGGGSGGGGGGIGGFLNSIFGGMFGGRSGGGGGLIGPGGTATFNPGASSGIGNFANTILSPSQSGGGAFFGSGSLNGVSSGSSDMLSRMVNGGQLSDLLHEAANTSGGGAASTATNAGIGGLMQGGLSGIGASLAPMLPFLGLGIGSSLYKDSKLASVFGGIGGTLAGISALGLLAPATLAGGIAGLGIGGAAALSIASAATVIGLVAAPALLLAGYFINRSAKRRQQEQQRTQILLDSKSQLQQIITQLQGGKMDSATALAQAGVIRQNYLNQVGQLSDKKTRNIAIATVRELDAMITVIQTEGARADAAASLEGSLVPTFASAGYVSAQSGMYGGVQFTGFGGGSYADHIPALLTREEVVLNRQNIMNIGGYDALRRAGVRGISMVPRLPDVSSRVPYSSTSNASAPAMYNIFAGSEKMANEIFDQVKGKGIARKMRLAVYTGDDDGFSDTLESKLAGEF